MQTFWQKLWFYTRMVITALIAINVILFIILNFGTRVEGDINFNFFTKFERPRLLLVLFVTAFVSILGWWLFWTIFRTIKQIRTGVERGRVERLTREVEDMKYKAARLQTKAPAATQSSEIDAPPPM